MKLVNKLKENKIFYPTLIVLMIIIAIIELRLLN